MKYMLKTYTEMLEANKKDEILNTDEVCIAFNNAFLNSNEELVTGPLDTRFSGSTCVTVLTLGQKLFCSNVGDSRGIVVKKKASDVTGKITAQAISRDQKPCQADEAARIAKFGGRIDSFRDPDNNPVGPLRVWLKNEDIPGLAMTRAFGDQVAASVGVTAEPGKYKFCLLLMIDLLLQKSLSLTSAQMIDSSYWQVMECGSSSPTKM